MLYLATLDEAKAILGITDTTDDVKLRLLLEGLQGRMDLHCNRGFLYQSGVEEIFDGGQVFLYPRRAPIDEVSEILVSAAQDWADPDITLAATDYVVARRFGKIMYRAGNWPNTAQSIRVTYTGGLIRSDGTAAPQALDSEVQAVRRAFLMQAAFEWRNRDQIGLASVSAQGVTVQQGAQVSLALAGKTLISEVETTLAPFVRYA